jgi:Flp pilus assembly pilin Flp
MNDTQEEVFQVNGEELLAKVRELIKAGNARRIILKNETGETLIEFPVTVGVIGAVLVPVFAAVGTIAALVAKCTIVVVKR